MQHKGRLKGFVVPTHMKPIPHSSLDVALETLHFLRRVVVYEKYETITELLDVLTFHGRWICAVEPTELVIRNVLMMVTKLARDENIRLIMGEPISAFDSLNKLWTKTDDRNGAASGKKLKKGLIQAINEVASEMTLCCENICTRAIDLINPQDVLIVHSYSGSVTWSAFLDTVRKTRKRNVMNVVHKSEADTTPDFASPIQLCDVGTRMCEATKITPFFVPDEMLVNMNKAPGLPFSYSALFSGLVEVIRPTYDVVPASLITLREMNVSCPMSISILPLLPVAESTSTCISTSPTLPKRGESAVSDSSSSEESEEERGSYVNSERQQHNSPESYEQGSPKSSGCTDNRSSGSSHSEVDENKGERDYYSDIELVEGLDEEVDNLPDVSKT
ncbi:unnamed protein product [Angiostrongylus costaricensis]|uniref:Translation initiation factor eIF2B subunit beta n=1 Tax=Angiostrongylus costaricensis TaxID=334426 RepID=A0A158PGK0_ANGCS|nr:unnamed protein product [Angiostrongylus costaricensis]